MTFVCSNIGVNAENHLTFAGHDTLRLAEEYGTPLYLMDEDRIRHNCRLYLDAFRNTFREGSLPHYAAKAAAFKTVCRVVAEEGMGIDVCSPGEIATAVAAGVDMSKVMFPSNGKSDGDIRYAMDKGIGAFVIDNVEELLAIEAEAEKRGITQNALLRLTPGIDPHTYAAVDTGKVDSKFGVAIETGQAEDFIRLALKQKHIRLLGYHCHVGSQVFGEDVFERTAAVMLDYIAEIEKKTGYLAEVLDLGGGYGVPYVAEDPSIDIPAKIASVGKVVKERCAALGIREPKVMMEPGRSIVADAGMTLYRVLAVKRITGYKSYVTVDGGMTDDPRYALYRSRYTVLAAGKMGEKAEFLTTLAGRCCESGDLIQENILLPDSVCRGDVIAVCTTGAYNYSMASNYNRFGRPGVVMLRGGESYVAVRRETTEDLLHLDE
jgi:diaminopimelate decarboxylase